MKKAIIALIVLIIGAGASVGAYLGVKKNKEKDDEKQAQQLSELVLFNFDSESVTKVDFDCGDENYTAELNEGIWSLTAGDSFPLDQDYLSLVCLYTSSLTAETSYENVNFSDYGLDSPYSVTIYDDKNSYKVNIGDVSPTGDYYYITVDGSDKVYTIASLYGSVLRAERMLLKSKSFIPYGSDGIAEITVTQGDELGFSVTYDKENDIWRLPTGYEGLVFDLTDVTAMVANLTRLEVEVSDMFEDNLDDLSKYGFDKPTEKAVFKGVDGSVCTYLFNDKYDEKEIYVYAYCIESGQVVRYAKSSVSFIYYRPIDFMLKSMPVVDIMDAREIDFEFGSIKEHYVMDVKQNKASVDGTDIDITDGSLNIAFRNFYNALAVLKLSDVDISITPELADPIVTAKFKLEDGSEKLYQIVEGSDNKCYAFVDGKYIGGITDSDNFMGINSLNDFHSRLMKAIGKE